MTDSAVFYATIKTQLQQELPFIVYRKPKTNTITLLFQKDKTPHYIHKYSESGFIFAPFNHQRQPLFIPSENYISCYDTQNTADISIQSVAQHTAPGKESYLQLVSKAIAAIKKGHFKKVVLSRTTTVNVSDLNVINVYKKLLSAYPTAFCYLWFHPQTGIWLGATPEILLTVKDNRLETMALAGTQAFTGTLNPVWRAKEKEEQQLVTHFIVHCLQPLVRELKVSDVQTVRAGNLLHLRTRITAKIPNSTFNIQHIIKALHPTPAVCGYPKEAAKQFILQHENYDRAFYTGFLGTLNFSASDSRNSAPPSSIYVNLRCMQVLKDKAILYAGGGITAASVPEHEWQETLNKAQTMLKVLS